MITSNNETVEKQELIFVLDYILNKAAEKELEVIHEALIKASNSKKRGFLSGINPELMAKQMSDSINQSIKFSLEGVRNTVRNFAEDILKNEAPELSQEQLNVLIDSWLPASDSGNVKDLHLAKNGKVNGIPSSVLYEMIFQFVSYGTGEMPSEKAAELKNSIGDWQVKYWERFPQQIKVEIKNFIEGNTTLQEFKNNIINLIS